MLLPVRKKLDLIFFRALMTHASVPPDQRELLGISDTLVSYSTRLD